ncbi:ADP-ribosylation factor-related protein 1 [Vitis vinifera]|uniref:ADP-ribosylation factor-related protein 1 n=1 Tax=Vitis vinifera TaxID=29760 RepID=A0A438I3X6_VITVI|nr:ADP-ribosylation factor-related protein 1 [Vitis vinifera]
MFSLFHGLWKYLFSKAEFHVLILGIDKAGKTTLLEKLKALYTNLEGLPPDRIVPTVGLNIGRVELSNTKLYSGTWEVSPNTVLLNYNNRVSCNHLH